MRADGFKCDDAVGINLSSGDESVDFANHASANHHEREFYWKVRDLRLAVYQVHTLDHTTVLFDKFRQHYNHGSDHIRF